MQFVAVVVAADAFRRQSDFSMLHGPVQHFWNRVCFDLFGHKGAAI
jgi:hypothetical protein